MHSDFWVLYCIWVVVHRVKNTVNGIYILRDILSRIGLITCNIFAHDTVFYLNM